METIKNILNYDLEHPYSTLNIAFLDIETDGLSHKNKLVIIGIIIFSYRYPNGNIIQLFNDDYGSEREMLLKLKTILHENAIDYYISFNGNAFDLPFLNARYTHYKINFALNKAFNVDIMRIVKKHKSHFNFSDFKLKTVERFLNIERSDTISGKDSIVLYHAYVETKSKQLKQAILLHNYEDLINMIPLLRIVQYVPNAASLIYPVKEINGVRWFITDIKIVNNILKIEFSCHHTESFLEIFEDSNGIFFERNQMHAKLNLDLILLNDSTNQIIKLIDSRYVLNLKMAELTQQDLNALVVAHADTFYPDTIEKNAFIILSKHLMNRN